MMGKIAVLLAVASAQSDYQPSDGGVLAPDGLFQCTEDVTAEEFPGLDALRQLGKVGDELLLLRSHVWPTLVRQQDPQTRFGGWTAGLRRPHPRAAERASRSATDGSVSTGLSLLTHINRAPHQPRAIGACRHPVLIRPNLPGG